MRLKQMRNGIEFDMVVRVKIVHYLGIWTNDSSASSELSLSISIDTLCASTSFDGVDATAKKPKENICIFLVSIM